MTIMRSLLRRGERATALTVRDDIITSDRLIGAFSGLGGGSVVLDTDYTANYEEIARRQLWVRIAVNKLAYSIGRLPLKVYADHERDGRDRLTTGPLAELLRRPNESKETGNAVGFQARLAYDLFVYGNAIVVKAQRRPDRAPDQLIPISPRGFAIRDGMYVHTHVESGTETVYEPWQIIHLMEPGPTASGIGVSRLEAARLTLAIEYAAQRLGVATFLNGARPGGIIKVNDLPTDPAARSAVMERFKAEVRARLGGVNRAGLPAVLEGNIDWLSLSHNLDDSAVVEHRQLTREEVAALYDIPQPAIGILDESNFASVDQLHLMFYQDSLGWPINLIEEVLARQLIDGVPEFDGQFVEFDLNAVMRGAFAQRMQGYQIGINGRIFTPDEVRGWENLPPMADQQPDAGLLQFPLNFSVSPESSGKEAP